MGDEKEAEAGDYQIRIHVIEARQLVSKDDGGTSDPVTKVTCSLCPETKATTVIEKTLNPFWDQTLIFEPQLKDPSELDMATVTIEVWDSDLLGDDMIGAFTVELNAMVYTQKDQEMWRTWLALTDTEGDEDGVQGYVKVTINVLGPGAPRPQLAPWPHARVRTHRCNVDACTYQQAMSWSPIRRRRSESTMRARTSRKR